MTTNHAQMQCQAYGNLISILIGLCSYDLVILAPTKWSMSIEPSLFVVHNDNKLQYEQKDNILYDYSY